MKHDDPFQEIGDLLRSHKPDPQPSPGLEARILRELDRRQRPEPVSWWKWLVVPPALAAVALLLWPREQDPASQTVVEGSTVPSRTEETREPEPLLIDDSNPLKVETAALRRDAKRAGRFLIDSLPTLSAAER